MLLPVVVLLLPAVLVLVAVLVAVLEAGLAAHAVHVARRWHSVLLRLRVDAKNYVSFKSPSARQVCDFEAVLCGHIAWRAADRTTVRGELETP